MLRELDDPEPPDGFVLLDVLAAGVNWADTHQAENSYLAAAELPLVPGGEVVGTTPDGKRVVALLNGGGYAERCSIGGVNVSARRSYGSRFPPSTSPCSNAT